MKSSSDPVQHRASRAIAAPHVIPLTVEDSGIPADNGHIIQLSAGVPKEALLKSEDGTVIHEMPRESEAVETRRRAA